MAATAPNAPNREHPVVSVVVPVLNEERDIGSVLQQILGQREPPGGFEVLVADGGSSDRTRETIAALAEQDPRLHLLENPRGLSSAGRNVGIEAARGTYILFVDGHCQLPRTDYLVRMVELFRATGAACLCRPQPLQHLADTGWAQAIAFARHSWLGHYPRSDIYSDKVGFTDPHSAGAAYERRVLLELGGFDERFDACEDVEFNHRVSRAGLRAYVHPDLMLHYRPRSTLRGVFWQMFRYGRGRAHLTSRHPRMIQWPLLAIVLGFLLILALVLTAGWEIAGLVVGATLVLWATALLIECLRLGSFPKVIFPIAFVFPLLYGGVFLGFCRGVFEFRRFRAAQGSAPWLEAASAAPVYLDGRNPPYPDPNRKGRPNGA